MSEEAKYNDAKNVIWKELKAAREQLAKLNKGSTPAQLAEAEAKQGAVRAAGQESIEEIVTNISKTKSSVASVLSNLESELVAKKEQLGTIETAINVQSENLENSYGIQKEADVLISLIEAQNIQKIRYKEEMLEQRKELQKEIDNFVAEIEEQKRALKQSFDRQKSEYDYNLKLSKRQSLDEFEQQKLIRLRDLNNEVKQIEYDLSVRENALKDKESEFQSLTNQVALFGSRLEDAVKLASEKATKKAEVSHGFKVRALEQSKQSDINLLEHEVANLKERLLSVTDENKHLKDQLERASGKLENIANNALQTSQARILNNTDLNGGLNKKN